jgi:hypothetical protein
MVEITETISKSEILRLFLGVLTKITEKAQENYSDELHVARRMLRGYEYDPFIYRKIKKTGKMLGIISRKTEEIDILVDIETNIRESTGKINVNISDAYIFPIAMEEIKKFSESHKEAGIKEIIFIKNFQATI